MKRKSVTKKEKHLKNLWRYVHFGIIAPLTCSITGLGMYTYYWIMNHNPTTCLFVGLFASAVSMLLFIGDIK